MAKTRRFAKAVSGCVLVCFSCTPWHVESDVVALATSSGRYPGERLRRLPAATPTKKDVRETCIFGTCAFPQRTFRCAGGMWDGITEPLLDLVEAERCAFLNVVDNQTPRRISYEGKKVCWSYCHSRVYVLGAVESTTNVK